MVGHLGAKRADGMTYTVVGDLPRILIPVARMPIVKVD